MPPPGTPTGEWTFLWPPSVPGGRSGQGAVHSRSPCLSIWHGHPLRGVAGAISFFCPSTWHGRRRWRPAGADWPFQMEAKCLHLELRHWEWTFLLPPSVPGERSGSEPSNHFLPGFPPGTVVATGGPSEPLFLSVLPPGTVVAGGGLPVPFCRSRWKRIASTWNSDRGNGRFCGHPSFQVKGRGQSRLIIVFPAFLLARSLPLEDRRSLCSFLSFHRARSSPLGNRRCRLAVPGGSKQPPPGTPTGGMDVSVAALRSR